MIYFLLFNLLLTGPFALKWYFPLGSIECTKMLIADTDHDGHIEFIFRTYDAHYEIYFCELHLPDTFQIYSTTYLWGPLPWDVGDFDLDGLYDLVIQADASRICPVISIAESPDSFSYPTQELWRDTIGQAAVSPISVYDIDRDGLPEIVKTGANGIDFVIYESIGDNSYERIYEDTIQGILTPTSTLAFGDFDEDGKIEFVLGNLSNGGSGANYWLYESPADNTYDFIHVGSLPTKNIKDCFAVDDADGDGKPEFVVKGFTVYGPPSHEIHTFIFEATGDNTYEIIKTFAKTYTGSGYYGGYSASGDVDGDGRPEIILEAATMLWAIKAVENDSFVYFASFTGYPTGSCVAIYDIDGNGLSEVIISGNNETRIYEYVPPGVEEASDYQFSISNEQLSVSPNPFTTSTTINLALPSAQEHKSTGAQGKGQSAEAIELTIYDVSGRLVKSVPLTTNHLSLGTDLKGGVYFLRLENLNSKEVISRKLIKIE